VLALGAFVEVVCAEVLVEGAVFEHVLNRVSRSEGLALFAGTWAEKYHRDNVLHGASYARQRRSGWDLRSRRAVDNSQWRIDPRRQCDFAPQNLWRRQRLGKSSSSRSRQTPERTPCDATAQERGADDGADLAALAGLDATVDLPISIERQRVFAVSDISRPSFQRGQELVEIDHVGEFRRGCLVEWFSLFLELARGHPHSVSPF
jgi:hypothetical protein